METVDFYIGGEKNTMEVNGYLWLFGVQAVCVQQKVWRNMRVWWKCLQCN